MNSFIYIKHTRCSKKIEKINIDCLEDLQTLPPLSMEVLFLNKNYIEVIYLYVIYKFDMYLQNASYSYKERKKYISICFGIIPKLIVHQEIFLSHNPFSSDKAFDIIPKEVQAQHKKCLENTCMFLFGSLSAIPYLDRKLFPKKEGKLVKHNYGNIGQILKII